MAMAKCVIASNLPAMREIVRAGETGLLCPAGDAEALAQACLSLLQDPALSARLGAAARVSMLKTRPWSRTLASYPALYAELVGAAPQTSANVGAGRIA
jgi:glycosyltransferase involved in cell wall biosynthesis